MKRKSNLFVVFCGSLIFFLSLHTCAMEKKPSYEELQARIEYLESCLKNMQERYQNFLLYIREQIAQFNELLDVQQRAHAPPSQEVSIQCDGDLSDSRVTTISPSTDLNCSLLIPFMAALLALSKDHLLAMNSLPATISTILMYEVLSKKKQLQIVTHFNFIQALRAGLYASFANALLERTLPVDSTNGWKVISCYILIDLVSTYAWNIIKKSENKPKQPSRFKKVVPLFSWGIKTCVSTILARALIKNRKGTHPFFS